MKSLKLNLYKYLLMWMAFISLMTQSISVYAQEVTYKSWNEVAAAMEVHIMEGAAIYKDSGTAKAKEAKDAINIAYYKFYERLGFEKTVMSYISGSRGAEVENQFYLTKKAINDAKSAEDVQAEAQKLVDMLHEDADQLDGVSSDSTDSTDTATQESGAAAEADQNNQAAATANNKQAQDFTTFMAAFGLTLREGLEAILVVAAIIAYLIKTDNKKYIKGVYLGAIAGIVVSVVLAAGFNMIAASIGAAESGASQEIFEGVAMFVAAVVLFYVSNWMLSKSEVEVWEQYIQTKVENSISTGNVYALIFASFLAVLREGAELILFFQGMRSNIANSPYHMWLGLGVAAVILVFIYIAVEKLSIRLPLKPFFMATSILMFILCISFVGKGVFELQEADVIGRTVIPAMNGFQFDLLGIYDRVETLIPQVMVLVITFISIILHQKNNKKIRAELEKKSQ